MAQIGNRYNTMDKTFTHKGKVYKVRHLLDPDGGLVVKAPEKANVLPASEDFTNSFQYTRKVDLTIAPQRESNMASIPKLLVFPLGIPTKNVIIVDLSRTPKCECGGAKMGYGRGNPGHSSWCPWRTA